MIIVPEKEALIRKFAGRKIRFYRKKEKMTQDEFGIRLAKELGKKAGYPGNNDFKLGIRKSSHS